MLNEKRVGRPLGSRKEPGTEKLTFRLAKEAMKQMRDLSEVLHISNGSVIAQAIARWHDSEPLMKKRKTNGDGNA